MPAHPRRLGVTPILVVFSLMLVACSSPASSASGSSPAPSPTLAASAAPTPEATEVAAFPVTITDDEGTSIDLAAAPRKIVSLTPATTEILFALGAGNRVVATDD